ncbi:MAG TPA: Rne/Rng family ribonuclease [Candidatus Acidoferrales bacterium]|jgi:ribonuclease G|nr:Rne/Rng family ribonuclease [Candidatus Acidoferrales bacterium]
MSKEMVISANPHETRVAILEEGQLCEYYVEREKEFALVGSIYKGRVTRVLPGMQSAFVEIGLDSDAFLYVTDFLEGIEEFDEHVATTAEEKIHKMEEQGGQVFPAASAAPALEPADVEPASSSFNAPPSGAPGEEFASERAVPSAPLAPPPPALNTSSPDRPQFESRSQRPDRGGRDFGRRGGGRRGGRFGRRDRGGRGGGGGDRRFGRELPPSKYASPRPHEDHSSEPALPSDYVPIILPGESLAKYKEKPPTAAPPSSIEENAAPLEAPMAAPEASAAVQEPPAPSFSEPVVESPRPARSEYRPSASGLEPLPGESISKWKHAEPAAAPIAETVASSELLEEIAADDEVQEKEQEIEPNEVVFGVSHHTDEVSPEIEAAHAAAPDLTDEEAAVLAEHVADAQSDELARAAEDRVFASPEEITAAEAADAEDAEAAAEEAEAAAEEEQALEEEEEVAETEGMIAPPENGGESEIGEHHEDALAAGESGSGENASAAENSAPQGQPWKASVRSNDFRARMQHPGRRGGRDRGRGRRDDRGRRPHQGHGGHGHRTQPRRPQLIADLLKQGQEIIVQIAKEPLGKKGARITSHIALPGRYLVYMPTLDHMGVSRKIASAEERSRLRHLVNDAKGAAGGGFIVRTAAASAAPEEVRADVEFLTRTWSEIKSRSEQRKAPSLLHRDLNLVERMLRDHISSDYGAIWVDSEEEYTKIIEFMSRFQPGLVNRVKLYTKENPVFEEFGIQQEIDKGLRPKVWLKSGGYIVINHTEALVAIDVNTGKFVGKGSNRLEDTIVRTNLEAVKEIVRQMRLRDLGGIIIIDFIDMEERRNREKVMAALEEALRADRAPSKMLRFNEFGLIAITRKRTKQALERTLCQPCPYCTGSGMVKSIPTLCYEIQTEARKMAPEMSSGSITLRVHPEIGKALKTRESSLVEELERWTKKSVIIQADPTLHWEQYDIY